MLVEIQDVYDVISEYYHHRTDLQHKALKDALSRVSPAQPNREYIEQIKWERDTAIQQLKELGYGLGEKIRDVDTISRQSAISLAGDLQIHGDEYHMYNQAINNYCAEIMGLPSAQPERKEGKWIPCSERLPEKEGWYITTVESEKTGKRRIENDLFAVDIALAHGHTPNKFCKDGYRQKTVAWMPFPEPWKGEQE